MTPWTQVALILFVVLALLLVLNAAGHLGSWLAKVGRAWLASRPPKPTPQQKGKLLAKLAIEHTHHETFRPSHYLGAARARESKS